MFKLRRFDHKDSLEHGEAKRRWRERGRNRGVAGTSQRPWWPESMAVKVESNTWNDPNLRRQNYSALIRRSLGTIAPFYFRFT